MRARFSGVLSRTQRPAAYSPAITISALSGSAPPEDFGVRHHAEPFGAKDAGKVNVPRDFGVAVIGKRHELHVFVPAFGLPPFEHAPEHLVGVGAAALRRFARQAQLVARVIGLAQPQNRDVRKGLDAPRELVADEKIRHRFFGVHVGEHQRNRFGMGFQNAFALTHRQNVGELMNARHKVAGVTVGVHVLQARAARRIGAVHANALAVNREELAHVGHGVKTFARAKTGHARGKFRHFHEVHLGGGRLGVPVAVKALERQAAADAEVGDAVRARADRLFDPVFPAARLHPAVLTDDFRHTGGKAAFDQRIGTVHRDAHGVVVDLFNGFEVAEELDRGRAPRCVLAHEAFGTEAEDHVVGPKRRAVVKDDALADLEFQAFGRNKSARPGCSSPVLRSARISVSKTEYTTRSRALLLMPCGSMIVDSCCTATTILSAEAKAEPAAASAHTRAVLAKSVCFIFSILPFVLALHSQTNAERTSVPAFALRAL